MIRYLKNLFKPLFSGRKQDERQGDEVPLSQPIEGIYLLTPRSYMLSPKTTTNCLVLGDTGERIVIIDPSPMDEIEYRKLVNTLKRLGSAYSDIFITHHHMDHHMNAPMLAKELSIPISISRDSYDRIIKYKKNYFENIDIRFPKEGDVLTRWSGKNVSVYEVPGHDEGQLALAPESMEWFLVGDLVESIGTVVIGVKEGDMAKYFQILKRIIHLNPGIIIPSHGAILKSIDHLEKTLLHRKQREQQVLRLHNEGKDPDQMVKILYRGVDKRLWPLALENMKSHLKKLKDEGSI